MTTSLLDTISEPKAHLFDLDGTLIDNEYFALRQIQSVIEASFNLDEENALNENFVVKRAGRPKEELIREYIAEAHIKIKGDFNAAVRGIEDQIIDARMQLEDDADVVLNAGVDRFLQHLKNVDRDISIVTSSERPRAELHILHTGLKPYFNSNRILSCESDIGHDYVKPNPAGYQQMIERTGFDGSECQAYEDSPSGIHAAKNAGIPNVIGIVGGRHILDKEAHAQALVRAGADLIINDFEQLFSDVSHIHKQRLVTALPR